MIAPCGNTARVHETIISSQIRVLNIAAAWDARRGIDDTSPPREDRNICRSNILHMHSARRFETQVYVMFLDRIITARIQQTHFGNKTCVGLERNMWKVTADRGLK
jgi:hypothetical protein